MALPLPRVPKDKSRSSCFSVPVGKYPNVSQTLSIVKVPSVVNIASNKPNVKSILRVSQSTLQDLQIKLSPCRSAALSSP